MDGLRTRHPEVHLSPHREQVFPACEASCVLTENIEVRYLRSPSQVFRSFSTLPWHVFGDLPRAPALRPHRRAPLWGGRAESLDTEAARPIQFSKNRAAPRASRPTAPESWRAVAGDPPTPARVWPAVAGDPR